MLMCGDDVADRQLQRVEVAPGFVVIVVGCQTN
jgi:hypothetical protein